MKYALVALAILAAAGSAMAKDKNDWIGTHLCREVSNYETSPTTRAAVDNSVAVAILVKTTISFTRTQDGGVSVTTAAPWSDKINEIIAGSSDFPVIIGMVQTYCAKFPDENLAKALPSVIAEFYNWK